VNLSELIRKSLDLGLASLRVSMPARVESYDVDTQTADVKPLLKDRTVTENGEIIESLPVVPHVPVAFLSGGGFFVSLPLKKGDTGTLLVCDRNIDRWMEMGGEQDPRDLRTHGMSGAVFYPGLHDNQHAIGDCHADNMVIGKDGGVQIHFKPDGVIHIGAENAAAFLARSDYTKSRLDTIQSTFDGHTHQTTATIGPSAVVGVISPPTSLIGALADIATTKTKAS
jgi:hypothetical protein